jgi:subtilase family serine protease
MSSRKPLRRRRRKPSVRPILEGLENRLVLSATAAVRPILHIIYHEPPTNPAGSTPGPIVVRPQDFGFITPVGYIPDQIRTAYGINNILFGSLKGDGKGQTIAIVDAYDDPAFVDKMINGVTNAGFSTSDLALFDKEFGLPDPPSFIKYNQTGQTTNLPPTDPAGAGNIAGTWEMEEALDIEWAHAIAPGASIDLVEANTDTNNNDLFTAVATAASLPGVSAISMSWGLDQSNGEQSVNTTFTTPKGHTGVTFVAASGDSGSPGYYPAYSPNVLAVGGTTLNINADNTYQGETAW